MKTELLPCPHCGSGSSVALQSYQSEQHAEVRCCKCGHYTAKCFSDESAVARWNRRAPTPDQRRFQAELEAIQTHARRVIAEADTVCEYELEEYFRGFVEGTLHNVTRVLNGLSLIHISEPTRRS